MKYTKDFGKEDIGLYDRFRFSSVFILQHIFKDNEYLLSLRREISQQIAQKITAKRKSEGLDGGKSIQVERRSDLSEKEFKKYVKKGIPVIFEGAALEWPCTKKWNLDYLEEQFGEESFLVVTRKGLVTDKEDYNKDFSREYSEKLSIKDFVQEVRNGGKKYMRFSPIMESHESLIEDFDTGWLRKMRQCLFGASYQTFIGASGNKTPIHAGMTAFFYIMADGDKHWTMYPTSYYPVLSLEADGFGYHYSKVDINNPDLKKYPGMDQLNRWECNLKKGDVLFIPAWYWHEVINTSESWGVSYRFPNIAGILKGSLSMTFVRLFLTNPSFLKVAYYTFFKSNISNRDENLLTPKLFKD